MEEIFKDYPDVVNIRQIAEMLQIGSVLAYKLVSTGAIKSRKIGREYKVSKVAVSQFLFDMEGNS